MAVEVDAFLAKVGSELVNGNVDLGFRLNWSGEESSDS